MLPPIFQRGYHKATSKESQLTTLSKLQTYYSPTTVEHIKNFAKSVEVASNGRIKIQVFTGGELVSSDNMLKAVQGGMIDIAHGCGAYYESDRHCH